MRTVLLVLAMLSLPAGCGRRTDATGLGDEQFVQVMVQLRQAADQTRGEPDSFPPLRDRILAEARVTEDQLLTYVQHHGTDLQHMAGIWQKINDRLSEPVE